jgi:hypothetical protein
MLLTRYHIDNHAYVVDDDSGIMEVVEVVIFVLQNAHLAGSLKVLPVQQFGNICERKFELERPAQI